jgi:hypothetical protein
MSEKFTIETSTIGLVLLNPTNEDLDMQYAGISLTLKAGEKRAYEIACARHLLNGFGQRGLTSLSYGANEEEIAKEGRERNIEFKKRMVTEYNQRNENRKHMGLNYHPPTEHVKKYAIELGLELLEPYRVRDEERGEVADLRKENRDLKNQVNDMMAQFKEAMEQMKQVSKQENKVTDFSCPSCKRVFGSEEDLARHKERDHKAR